MAGRKGNREGTIVKRNDGRWCAAITIGTDDEGKLMRKWIYGKSRNDVAKQMNNIIFDVNSDNYAEPCKTKFCDYSLRWIELYKKNLLKAKSFDRLLNTHQMVLKSYLGSVQLGQLKTDMIQTYILSLSGKFSYSTIKKVYELFNACFKHAIVKGDLKDNPCVGVVLPREPDDIKDVTAFTSEQQEIIANEVTKVYKTGKDVYKYGYGYILIMNTGLRLGEALGLTWNDINFEKKILHVTKSVSKVKENKNGVYKGYKLIVDSPKTKAARRTVYLNDKAIIALNHLKEQHKDIDNNIVLSSVNGKHLDPSAFSKLFSSICKKVGMSGYTVHSLRHTFATNLFRKKIDIKHISCLLGHADIKTTYNTYIHLLDDVNEAAINAIKSL